jgi:tetratricopeptide (TPR) repeat protein
VISLVPGDSEALYLRGLAQARLQDHEAAIADFSAALERSPYHVLAWLHRGHAYRRLGDFAQAIRDYGQVLRHHPGNALAYSGRGLTCKLAGEHDQAIADFTEALRLESNNPLDYYHRGTLYRTKGDLVRAHADFDEAIRLHPENWPALYYRGKILLAKGQYSLAIFDLTEVVRLNPTLGAGYLSRALSYDRLGNRGDALADADRAIELRPESSSAHLVRGVLLAHQGDHPAAIADLTEAIRLNDRFALAYHERGMAHLLQGDHDSALADCNQYIALESGNAEGYATRSIIYHFKGEIQRALADYSRALQIDPKRILTGWNQSLAETARDQTTQRIADYIDGLWQETPLPDPGLSSFQMAVVKTGEIKAAAARRERPTPLKPVRKEKLLPLRLATDSIPSASEPEPPAPDGPASQGPSEGAVDLVSAPAPATALHPMRETIALAPEPEPEPQAAEAPASEESEDMAAEFLSLEDDAAEDSPEALEPQQKRSEGAPPKKRKGKVEWDVPGLAESAAPPKAVTCRNCNRETILQPVSEDRGRCEHCKSVFPLSMSAKPPVRQKQEREPFLETWRKPLSIVAVAAAAVLVLVVFRGELFGKGGRVRVHRAQGKAQFDGKPMANATVFLHPVGEENPRFPRPRAIVQEDGTFQVGTYRKDDGAPAGEYKVTVQWFSTDNHQGMPVNVLPAKYAEARSSDLVVRIEHGENLLPVISLRSPVR